MATLTSSSTDALRETLPDLADDMIAAIASEVPDYARAMEGRFGEVVRFGVEVALNRFVDVLGGAAPKSESSARDTYVRLGAGEYRAGRTLDALLAAYRVGAKLAWRRFVEAGTRAGFAPDALYDLGEAMFAYIDEISAESAAGFAEAQSEAAGESQRRRRALVRLLAQEPPAAEETLRTAAQSAGWTLPRRVAAVVVGEAEQPEATDELDNIAARLARRLGPGAVGAAVSGLAAVMLPDPDGPGRRKALESALGDDLAALGPAVSWPEAGRSLRRAAAAYRLAAQGRIGDAARGGARDGAHQRAATAAATRQGGASSSGAVFVPARRRGRASPRVVARGGAGARGGSRAVPARPARHARRGAAGTARGDAAGVAGPARAGAGGGRGARRAPADRAVPAQAAAGAVRGAVGGPGGAL